MNSKQPGKDEEWTELAELRRHAPPGFHRRVMAAIAKQENRATHGFTQWQWSLPRLAGAMALMMVLTLTIFWGWRNVSTSGGDEMISGVVFRLNAPEAQKVELVGDFTAWQTGRISFDGPDTDGNWQARIELPEGRYEYLFLVDGQRWVTDISAPAHRADGFGNLNAIINI